MVAGGVVARSQLQRVLQVDDCVAGFAQFQFDQAERELQVSLVRVVAGQFGVLRTSIGIVAFADQRAREHQAQAGVIRKALQPPIQNLGGFFRVVLGHQAAVQQDRGWGFIRVRVIFQ